MTGSVAVICAGPGGLVATRWLLSQGFEPAIFEQAPMLGGQWTGLPATAAVADDAYQHQSRADDLRRPRHAEKFDLVSRIRFGTRVDLLGMNDTGWVVGHFGAITSK